MDIRLLKEFENNLLNEIKKLLSKDNANKEWESISQAVEILGIPRDDIMARIQNGEIPFRKSGSHYKVNIKLVRAYFCSEDVDNMKKVQREIKAQPFSMQKVTKDINNKQRPQRVAKVRKVIV